MAFVSEEEELKKIPYEAEILLCNYLINYLEGFIASSNADVDESETKLELEVEVDGKVLHAYRRDDSDEGASKKKKGKKSKKQVTAGVKHDRIVHTVGKLVCCDCSRFIFLSSTWLTRRHFGDILCS